MLLQEKRRIRLGTTWLSALFAGHTTYAFLKKFEKEYGKDLHVVEILAKVMYESVYNEVECNDSKTFLEDLCLEGN